MKLRELLYWIIFICVGLQVFAFLFSLLTGSGTIAPIMPEPYDLMR